LFYYPVAIYFYTNKANKATEVLARWIKGSLEQLANEGTIQRFMTKHSLTAPIFSP
jgi:hypothetical protein